MSDKHSDWYLSDIGCVAPAVIDRYKLPPATAARIWRAYLAAAPRPDGQLKR